MHFDIVEAIRQKQFKHRQSIQTENGDPLDISISGEGRVIISPQPAEGVDPADPVV